MFSVTVKASNTENNDRFGQGLALSGDGNTLAVGAPMEDSAATGSGGDDTSNGAIDSGAVFVYRRENGQWALQGYVKASRAVVSALFGSQVALSGDGTTLAVAAPSEDSSATGVDGDQANAAALNSGAVYVFTLDGDRCVATSCEDTTVCRDKGCCTLEAGKCVSGGGGEAG